MCVCMRERPFSPPLETERSDRQDLRDCVPQMRHPVYYLHVNIN